MAATVTGATRDGREGSASRSNFDLRDEVTLTDVYWVETNDANDNADVAMLAAGVPRLGDIHPRINSLRVSRVSAQNVSGRTDRWKVPVLYEQEPAEEPDVDIDFEIHRVPIVGGAQLIAGPMGTATPAPAGGVARSRPATRWRWPGWRAGGAPAAAPAPGRHSQWRRRWPREAAGPRSENCYSLERITIQDGRRDVKSSCAIRGAVRLHTGIRLTA